MWLLIKVVLFTIVVPGTVAGMLPYWVWSRNASPFPTRWGGPQIAAIPFILIGLAIYIRCAWDFAHRGRGTPAPIDAPRVLVVEGLYRYVRNPMYLGVLLVIYGWALLLQSTPVAIYATGWFVVVHAFVVWYEEPTLNRTFGQSYESYRNNVRRWLPGKAYHGSGTPGARS
jgi:protein-S-isoprenylcysteine O-methyltransferase Ste14